MQVAVQVRLPEAKPCVTQVWLLRLAPSQVSPASNAPLPQVGAGGVVATVQLKLRLWKLSVAEKVVLYLSVEPLKQGEAVRVWPLAIEHQVEPLSVENVRAEAPLADSAQVAVSWESLPESMLVD